MNSEDEIAFKVGIYERTFLSRIKRAMNFKTDEQVLVFCIQYTGERLQHIKRSNAKRLKLAEKEEQLNKRAKRQGKTIQQGCA